MDTEIKKAANTENADLPEPEGYPFVKGSVPAAMSGAEAIAYWKEHGCFEVWAEQYKDIGPGKKYADSTEYVQAMRARADYRGH